MHTSDACGPFKRTHTCFESKDTHLGPFKRYTYDPFKGHFDWKETLLSEKEYGRRIMLVDQNKREVFRMLVVYNPSTLATMLQNCCTVVLLRCSYIFTNLVYKNCTSKATKITYPIFSNLFCFPSQISANFIYK